MAKGNLVERFDDAGAFEGDVGEDGDGAELDPAAQLRRERELEDTSPASAGGSAGRAERELGQVGDEVTLGFSEMLNGIARLEVFAKKSGAKRAIGRFVRARLGELPAELEKAAARLRAALGPATKPAEGN